jgi:hypothetical protein
LASMTLHSALKNAVKSSTASSMVDTVTLLHETDEPA